MKITYRTSGFIDSREVTEDLRDFVAKRSARSSDSIGRLVDLLVERGILSLDDVFETFKSLDDYERIG